MEEGTIITFTKNQTKIIIIIAISVFLLVFAIKKYIDSSYFPESFDSENEPLEQINEQPL